MRTIQEITDKAIENKRDFMYKKTLIPDSILIIEDTYQIIIETKGNDYRDGLSVKNDCFIGLRVVITKEEEKDLKVGILQC